MVNVCFFIMHNRCIINIGLSSNFQPVFVFIFTEHFLQVALLFVSYKTFLLIKVSSVQSRLTFCNPMNCSTTGFSVHHQLPELTQIHVHWVSDAIQPSHLLSSPSSPASIFPSIRVFSNESVLCIRWPKDWSFSFSISPSNEYSGLISFRLDGFDLLAVQGTLKKRVFSNTTFQKHQFFSAQPSLWSSCHIHTWLLEKA